MIRLYQKQESEKNMTRLQDDFYDAINGEWAKTAVIPDDKPVTGGFTDLSDEIEKLMLSTTDRWLRGEEVPNDAILQNFIKYHRLAAFDCGIPSTQLLCRIYHKDCRV